VSSRLAVVGGANKKPGGPTIAFEWQRSSLKFLGALKDGNPLYSFAMATSAKNGIVGCSNAADGMPHAVLWQGGTITDIGASADFPQGTCAYAINQDGDHIVGSGEDAAGQPHALRFEGGQVVSLETEVQGLTGWKLLRATGVNDDGVIVGIGQLDGELHGFMLTPTGGR
jgi:probable HAF family extracellular repeat protein